MSALEGIADELGEAEHVADVPEADMADDRNGSVWPSDTSESRWMMRSPLPRKLR
jgi:hypothetical protein